MGYRDQSNPLASFSPNGTQGARNTGWKASAFLNLYAPSADPSDANGIKIGFIALRAENPIDRQIIENLQDAPQEQVDEFIHSLTAKFNVSSRDSKVLALPSRTPAPAAADEGDRVAADA